MMTRRKTVVALSLGPDGVTACRARLRGGRPEVLEQWEWPVPADLLRNDPDRAGTDLRRYVADAGLHREPCVVCLPLAWAFTSRVTVADEMTEPEFQAFVEAEAERQSPVGLDDLSLAIVPQGPSRAFLAGVPYENVASVEGALRLAGLRPASMTLQTAPLLEEEPAPDGTILTFGPASADMALTDDGQLLALRSLAWADRDERTDAEAYVREVGRQLRISLAHLPTELRDELSCVHAYGLAHLPEPARAEIIGMLERQGLVLDEEAASRTEEAPADLVASARAYLLGARPRIELLPRRVSRVQRAVQRLSERRVRVLVEVGVTLVLVIGCLWFMQQRDPSQLEAQWRDVEPQVATVKGLQEQVRKFRSWYDPTVPNLSVLKSLAVAFPEEGVVWVKTLQIRDASTVTCSGSAKTRADWMALLDKLQSSDGLHDVQVVSTRGESPLTFTLTLQGGRSTKRDK